jgi:hypothetical protein
VREGRSAREGKVLNETESMSLTLLWNQGEGGSLERSDQRFNLIAGKRTDVPARVALVTNNSLELVCMSQHCWAIMRGIGEADGWEREIETETDRVGYVGVIFVK